MQLSDISFDPPRRTLRQFAGLWILVFSGWAGWCYWARGEPGLALLFVGIAGAIGLPGLLAPRLMRPIYVGWMCLTFPIGWLVSHMLLACVFYGLFTPLGLLFRLLGRDPLAIRSRPGQNSYWRPRPLPGDGRSYYRQS